MSDEQETFVAFDKDQQLKVIELAIPIWKDFLSLHKQYSKNNDLIETIEKTIYFMEHIEDAPTEEAFGDIFILAMAGTVDMNEMCHRDYQKVADTKNLNKFLEYIKDMLSSGKKSVVARNKTVH